MGGVIKTLPEIASKFLFTSLRCKLIIELLFLITLRNSVKSQSIVETIFLTFYGSVIKTLPEIASKFLFTSSRCELIIELLFLITLRNSVKSQSIVETIFLTFYVWEAEKRWFWRCRLARTGKPLVPNAVRDEPRKTAKLGRPVAGWVRSL